MLLEAQVGGPPEVGGPPDRRRCGSVLLIGLRLVVFATVLGMGGGISKDASVFLHLPALVHPHH